mmetsp:Transcript_10279/g.27431  ORF Transcript_10279/g.27431 Transcript_10279/m.27431 type:complete len:197 (-) Transcript_10279:108-698(-)
MERPSSRQSRVSLLVLAVLGASAPGALRSAAAGRAFVSQRAARHASLGHAVQTGRQRGVRSVRLAAEGSGEKKSTWTREGALKQIGVIFALAMSTYALPPDLKYATVCYRSKQYTREYWDNPMNVEYAKSKGMTQEQFEKMYLDDPRCEELGVLSGRYQKFFSGQDYLSDIPEEKRITKSTQFGFFWDKPGYKAGS